MKRLFVFLAAVMVLCVSGLSLAAPSQVSQSRAAIAAAEAEIPASCNMIGYTEKDGISSIVFQDTDTLEHYYVKVVAATSKVKEIEVKGATFIKGSTIINKTPEEIISFVEAEYLDARDITVKLEKEGNNSYYKAQFKADRFEGEMEFNPATGAIIERSLEYYL